ncbi:MAG TPA: DMT family transporter [Mesorhizobium sp.]|jgi:drug/metabolite transporter (DMT)-like permease|nr:DMT family transporter [Mesorhizobium sp.]
MAHAPLSLPRGEERPLVAILCLCAGIGLFSVQDLVIKLFSDRYPITEAMAVRSVVGLPLLLVLVWLGGGLKQLKSRRLGLIALRAVMAFSAYMCYYMAIAALPLADVAALFFIAPLIISLLAVLFLGERLKLHTVLALLAGFAGVFVMLRPGAGVFEWAGLLVVLAATLYGGQQILSRRLSDDVSAPVLTFYQNAAFLFGAPLLAALLSLFPLGDGGHPSLAFLLRPWIWPSAEDLSLMAACGVIASVAMTLLSQAYRLAPAARVATFEYSAILWAPLWGFLIFGETPTALSIVGAVLICGAGIFALRRDLAESSRKIPDPAVPASRS